MVNYSYVQNKMALQPYEVWVKKADGVTDTQINDEIIKKDLDITFIEYADQELVKMKNDAMIQGERHTSLIQHVLISLLRF